MKKNKSLFRLVARSSYIPSDSFAIYNPELISKITWRVIFMDGLFNLMSQEEKVSAYYREIQVGIFENTLPHGATKKCNSYNTREVLDFRPKL